MSKRIALVTGGNKGIGYAIVQNLCQNQEFKEGHVILSARIKKNGDDAVEALKKEGYKNVSFVQCDIDDEASVKLAAEEVKSQFGGLDILINNAGMAFKGDAFDENVAKTTLRTNYFGTKLACNFFIPIMRPGGRVVNVSSLSSNGALNKMSPQLQQKFLKEKLTTQELDNLMFDFIDAVKRGKWKEEGWPKTCYGVSKVGVSMLTRILAAQNKGLCINACCPGWVRTDMAGLKAPLSPAEGSDTPVYCALQKDLQSGGMFSVRKKIGWGV